MRNLYNKLTITGGCFSRDFLDIIELFQQYSANHPTISRTTAIAVISSLPGAFILYTEKRPRLWLRHYQVLLTNALRVGACVTISQQSTCVHDILLAAFIMISFEVCRWISSENRARSTVRLASETPLRSSHVVAADSARATSLFDESHGRGRTPKPQLDVSESMEEQGDEIRRLQRTLAEVKTAVNTKDLELKAAQADLHTTQETLGDTSTECANLRDELKTMKQSVGRDHQAIIYRKDIELFALRKANEQKERYIQEIDAKSETTIRQHKANMELKETQIRSLKKRVESLQRNGSRSAEEEWDEHIDSEHQSAVQVKILRVKGRHSQEEERTSDEKDREISRLTEALEVFKDSSETLARAQSELRRAWSSNHDLQKALNKERSLHAQTREQLEEAAVRLEEEGSKTSQKVSPMRLPTIEESDKQELEAMFNTAQQDNLRLYSEHEALDKRLREANARLFANEQEMKTLRELVQFEKSINEDMENARPSLVHRVHFQRLEGQLQECRTALAQKDEEISHLRASFKTKEKEMQVFKCDKEAADSDQRGLQTKVEQLQKYVTELETTKEQLMLDHERLAHHRARQRISSGDYTSARSSGATLITEPILTPPSASSDVPLPTRPMATIPSDSSIQMTPERMRRAPSPSPLRIDTSIANIASPPRSNMISTDIPPPELRSAHTRRKSLTLKGLMRKMARRDTDATVTPHTGKDQEDIKDKEKVDTPHQRPKTALVPKDKNASLRPQTATAHTEPSKNDSAAPSIEPSTKQRLIRPKTANAAPDPTTVDKENANTTTSATPARYYTDKLPEPNTRPKTAVSTKDKITSAVPARPKSRGWSMSWKKDSDGTSASAIGTGSVSRKLVRRSLA
ncbi:hypothetical protein BU24DRAFT_392126 [Aaosphaeria arxii CBS 175.79]|uniref:Uncharacterized protein n=1 Tax=Aaosphaeria arxii CBS 175.79 TaxID=1450172 RepID=A0A6A5XVU7_9PLEO|nr:uncharacterized protein BU24DRAFT_392126 [Aaosphaeria arxii CBS 175.79]KAF2016760.1 hypothetical protein BU24DRAFT_392126 [Aaosphaeria arxii CBS 175.79]